MKKGPEALTQKLILDWLAANRIWFERRNTGAVVSSYKGKTRMTRFSRPGTADIMATRPACFEYSTEPVYPPVAQVVWIECKAPKGKQSEPQKIFQEEVEAAGHNYVLARSLEDVIAFFNPQ